MNILNVDLINFNNFGAEGKDISVTFQFGDERDEKYDTKNGCAFVWLGGELDKAINYNIQGNTEGSEMFSEEEQKLLYNSVIEKLPLLEKYTLALAKSRQHEKLGCHTIHIEKTLKKIQDGLLINTLDEVWVDYFLRF